MKRLTSWTILLCHIHLATLVPLHDFYDISHYETEVLEMMWGRKDTGGSSTSSSKSSKRKHSLIGSTAAKFKLTNEMKTTLRAMENKFQPYTELPYKWKDVIEYPTPQYQKRWNNHCRQVWPGNPKFEGSQSLCVAKLHPMPGEFRTGGARYQIHFHTTKKYTDDTNSFYADLVRCECRYLKPDTPSTTLRAATIFKTKVNFFTLGYCEDNVYFLMELLPGRKSGHLRIASYAIIPSTEDN